MSRDRIYHDKSPEELSNLDALVPLWFNWVLRLQISVFAYQYPRVRNVMAAAAGDAGFANYVQNKA